MKKIQIYLIFVILIGFLCQFIFMFPIIQILGYALVAILSFFALLEYRRNQKSEKLSKVFFWAFLAILIFSILLVIKTIVTL
ncbi:MAG: hypothetical protein Q8N99_00720 [Nanoarchaeota archaeon]|nr:hypothetical protein [Nanoarchaeota archaeon]